MKTFNFILKIIFIIFVFLVLSVSLIGVGVGLGMIASDLPGFPHVQFIAGKIVFNHDLDENEMQSVIAFPGCSNEFDGIINTLREHTPNKLSETMVVHLEQPTSDFLNWRMQTVDGIPFYARYQTDGIYNINIVDLDKDQFEKTTIQPLIADLKTQGFEFNSLGDVPVYQNENMEYVRRISFTKKFKSILTGEQIEGKYILEAQEILPIPDAPQEYQVKPKVSLTLNCKEDAEGQNYQAYNQIYDWYSKSAKKIEPDTVVGIDSSYFDNYEKPSESKIFVFEIGTPSNAWNDAPKEVWIKDGEDKIKMVEKINTKPDCAILAKNAITDVMCVHPLTGKLEM